MTPRSVRATAVRRTQLAMRQTDPEARAYAFQDDLDAVCAAGACGAGISAFHAGCAAIGLRANATKLTVTPGRETDVLQLPAGVTAVGRPLVLKHGPEPKGSA